MLEKLKILLYALFAYLNIDSEPFFILMVLMCVDSVIGAIKAIRLGQVFSFTKMLTGITLKLCFLIIPLLIALMGKSLGYDFHHPVSIILSILSIAECYSILGNIYTAKNKRELARMDVISELLLVLRFALRKLVKSLMKKVTK
tara:strand:+ start:208 stop:639 length:432 start_codon:yes stop_codon:yes gene_type:complete